MSVLADRALSPAAVSQLRPRLRRRSLLRGPRDLRGEGLGANNQGLLEAEINPLGYRTTNQYDDVGNRIARIDPLGNRWSQSFDAAGRVIATENPLGHRRTAIYDSRGLVKAEVDPLGYRDAGLPRL